MPVISAFRRLRQEIESLKPDWDIYGDPVSKNPNQMKKGF
jgi:hypothetical protein